MHFLQRRLPTAAAAMETSTGRLQRMWWWPRLSVESSWAWQGPALCRCCLLQKCSWLHGSIKTINHPNNPPPPSSTVLAKKLRANYKHTHELIITNVYVSATKWEKQRTRGRDTARVRLHCAIKELPIFIFEQETKCNLLKGGRGMQKGCGQEPQGVYLTKSHIFAIGRIWDHMCEWTEYTAKDPHTAQ